MPAFDHVVPECGEGRTAHGDSVIGHPSSQDLGQPLALAPAIRLRNIRPARRQRSIRSTVNTIVEVQEIALKIPAYSVHVISSTPGAADFFKPKKLARRTSTLM